MLANPQNLDIGALLQSPSNSPFALALQAQHPKELHRRKKYPAASFETQTEQGDTIFL